MHNHTNTDLSVTCSGGGGADDGSSVPSDLLDRLRFHLEVRDRETGKLLQNQSSDRPEFTIRYVQR